MQNLEPTKGKGSQLASRVDEAEMALCASQEHVEYLEEKLAEHSNHMLGKDNREASERERLSEIDVQVTGLWADLQPAPAPNGTDKNLSEAVKTALALQKTEFQQYILSYVKGNMRSWSLNRMPLTRSFSSIELTWLTILIDYSRL